ncbi:MAG: hypothetical protein KA004_17430 [Verrucomicrobiales bacterium]|nr:hypothetical protein [Verrucomicrobiales bacterium]
MDPISDFATHQDQQAAARNPKASADALLDRVEALLQALLQDLNQDSEAAADGPVVPPRSADDIRAEIIPLIPLLTWQGQPAVLTLGKEALVRDLWRSGGVLREATGQSLPIMARIVGYIALHSYRELMPDIADPAAMLAKILEFWDAKVRTEAEEQHLQRLADALWDGHKLTKHAPAPAGYSAYQQGNEHGRPGNTPAGRN